MSCDNCMLPLRCKEKGCARDRLKRDEYLADRAVQLTGPARELTPREKTLLQEIGERFVEMVREATRFAPVTIPLAADESAQIVEMTRHPEPPWPASAEFNSAREGWKAFFEGRRRDACPFPPDRQDLLYGYQIGWDEASLQDPELKHEDRL